MQTLDKPPHSEKKSWVQLRQSPCTGALTVHSQCTLIHVKLCHCSLSHGQRQNLPRNDCKSTPHHSSFQLHTVWTVWQRWVWRLCRQLVLGTKSCCSGPIWPLNRQQFPHWKQSWNNKLIRHLPRAKFYNCQSLPLAIDKSSIANVKVTKEKEKTTFNSQVLLLAFFT